MTSRRRVCYVTGTRADFGLMRDTLSEIQRQEDLDLERPRGRQDPPPGPDEP